MVQAVEMAFKSAYAGDGFAEPQTITDGISATENARAEIAKDLDTPRPDIHKVEKDIEEYISKQSEVVKDFADSAIERIKGFHANAVQLTSADCFKAKNCPETLTKLNDYMHKKKTHTKVSRFGQIKSL